MTKEKYPKVVFTGSAMDGLDVDLVERCGLEPIPIEKYDDVWSDVDPLNLMLTCIANVSIESKYGPEIPLYSDVFYNFVVYTKEEETALVEEVRKEITDRLKR